MNPGTKLPAEALAIGEDDTVVPQSAGLAKTAVPASLASTAAPAPAALTLPPPGARTTQARTTVLPSYTGAELVHRERDRYQVVQVLGRGGMGEVSLARDHDIDRPVALKYLHPQLSDAGMVARFVEEIRTIGHLEHPNIVPIHDVGLDEQGRYFFVMKHLEGQTLETIIEKLRARDPAYEARFTHERRAEIVIGILNALQFAHERGIIHRDIKPANVMVGHHGEVVLMDWGIAKAMGSKEQHAANPEAPPPPDRLVQTQFGSLLGTPLYMSPEQADGKVEQMDARSDIYSVVVLLYELMTLEHYLDGRNDLPSILEGVRTVVPDPNKSRPTKYAPCPPGFLHVARKGLQKDPALRFQSAGDLLDRLHRELDGEGEVHCRMTAMRRASTWFTKLVDRHPGQSILVAMGATAFLLTTTAISAVALVQWLGH